ncbi:Fe(3+) ABC transporter substrate-binding protein [Marinomonas piezotolerans]|uniref:Fe(3+) ABC transporter substrate-binding protein n=1 Tax=Marinomonas piezotolerans TaxID=2213058 RepID=A0A370U8L7_9GAMM|nr:Fe(3+) ABC transporter substrate-binding protein [Marinomonas piezotolerans]RDL44078.1 Fe(3+) ABC transporter substrate-binding protein [Marinomonas piezotolerans]
MNSKKMSLTLGLSATLITALYSQYAISRGEVNIYSARKEALIAPALEAYAKKYHVQVNLITGNADTLLQRLKQEGDASPADIFITVDAGRLQRAKDAGVLQPFDSDTINAKVPSHLRDSDNYWVGLSQRARVIFYNPKKINQAELSTYEALADPKWKGRICVRSSENIYNQSLVASMIAANGERATGEWIKGLVANLARAPFGGDTDLLRAVEAGVCDLTLANTYYFGRLGQSNKPNDQQVFNNVALFWPNQATEQRGAHVNVSGIGLTHSARNSRNARRLMEFLVSQESQNWYADVNNEYPVIKNADFPSSLTQFGTFKADTLPLNLLGEYNRRATELMDANGWK